MNSVSNNPSEFIRLPWRALWYFLIVVSIIPIIALVYGGVLLLSIDDPHTYFLLLLFVCCVLLLRVYLPYIMFWKNHMYSFTKQGILIRRGGVVNSLSTSEIERFDLIQDDIIAAPLGLEIIGICTKTQKKSEELMHKPLSEIPLAKSMESIIGAFISRGGSLRKPVNPGLRLRRKSMPFYDIYLPLEREKTQKIKDFFSNNREPFRTLDEETFKEHFRRMGLFSKIIWIVAWSIMVGLFLLTAIHVIPLLI